MVEVNTYRVRATRDGRFWLLTVPELEIVTQARRLTEADEMARDLIATWLDVDPDTVAIDLDVVLPGNLAKRRERVQRLREQSDRLREQATEELRSVVRDAHQAGLTVRELAVALGVSHQRAQQILAESRHRLSA